jgi:ketosteroid isomerase-like protein
MMFFQRATIAILSLTMGISVCCGSRRTGKVPEELQQAIDAFYAAVEAGDGEARIEMFTDDAIMMPNHWTLSQGKDAIAKGIRAGENIVFRLRDREQVDMGVSADLAYTVNSYYYTYHQKDAPPQWHKTKNVHVWKRMPDGGWRLHVDIWNSDVPLDQFRSE